MKAFTILLLLAMTMSQCMASDTVPALKYLVRAPKIKSSSPPVLILLHGVGSNEADLFSLADQLPDKYLVISARAPIELGNNRFAWYQVDLSTGKPVYNPEQAEKSRNTIIQFIGQIREKYKSKEVYLCGFSQGAIMSYSVALTRPDLVNGIAAISGRVLDDIKPKTATTQAFKNLNILILHGKNDNVLPVQYATTAEAYIKTLGITPQLHQYEAGHEINRAMLADLINWLNH
ncbi:MAG: dienelactone hydrolase family protein [Saprospiraceae bacterium]|nr:dienelactone hydrolase family protein [Saprospiraceae bacterium]